MTDQAELRPEQAHNPGVIGAGSRQDRHSARSSCWRTTSKARSGSSTYKKGYT